MVTPVGSSLEQDIGDLTLRAKQASAKIATLTTQTKNSVLLGVATALSTPQTREELMAANQTDLAAAQERGISTALLDRLTLNEKPHRPDCPGTEGDGHPARSGGGGEADVDPAQRAAGGKEDHSPGGDRNHL